MGQRPVTSGGRPQDRIWSEIRRRAGTGEPISIRTVRDVARASDKTTRDYIARLVAGGYLDRVAVATASADHTYTLVRDTGHRTPRVRRDGTPVTQGAGTQQMWATLRRLGGSMTARDLAVAASTDAVEVAVTTAQSYLIHLTRAGYCRASGAGEARRWLLLKTKDTGPRAPQIQRTKAVFDPNLGRVVWTAAGGSS